MEEYTHSERLPQGQYLNFLLIKKAPNLLKIFVKRNFDCFARIAKSQETFPKILSWSFLDNLILLSEYIPGNTHVPSNIFHKKLPKILFIGLGSFILFINSIDEIPSVGAI